MVIYARMPVVRGFNLANRLGDAKASHYVNMDQKKILVLMSGGVDSSTAAALLNSQGHEVAGVYLKLWDSSHPLPPLLTSPQAGEEKLGQGGKEIVSPPFQGGVRGGLGDPCWALEMKDAARVAAKLGIPFTVWDVTEEYKTRVLENFYSEYAAGRTPNPDVLCNSEIKFGIALERALQMGYTHVVTGHYARVHNPPQPSLTLREGESANVPPLKVRGGAGELCQLYAAIDKNKDQSYFLWRLTQDQLAHVLFPIGEYTKPQVRELAKKFGLHNAQKKDSQGVCFLGKIDLKEFLYTKFRHPEVTPKDPAYNGTGFFTPLRAVQNDIIPVAGPIVDVHGNLLGFHDGLAHFTIGQRHGTKLGGTGPYFVVEKDIASNTLIVANEVDEPEYRAVECTVRDVNWTGSITPSSILPHQGGGSKEEFPSLEGRGQGRVMARTRYRAPLAKVVIARSSQATKQSNPHEKIAALPLVARNDNIVVTFDTPQRAVAPGQSIVFYDGDRVIGGGVIDTTTLLCPVVKLRQAIESLSCIASSTRTIGMQDNKHQL